MFRKLLSAAHTGAQYLNAFAQTATEETGTSFYALDKITNKELQQGLPLTPALKNECKKIEVWKEEAVNRRCQVIAQQEVDNYLQQLQPASTLARLSQFSQRVILPLKADI